MKKIVHKKAKVIETGKSVEVTYSKIHAIWVSRDGYCFKSFQLDFS